MSINSRKFIVEFNKKLENSKNPFLDEADDVEIEETKPNRLKHHLFNKDASFAQLSAERNNKIFEPHPLDSDRVADKKKKLKQRQSQNNNELTKQLLKDIKDMGLSYIKTYGHWKEDDLTTQEHSYIIPNITKEQALELGAKYKQFGVIFREKGDDIGVGLITDKDSEDFGEKYMDFYFKDKDFDIIPVDKNKELQNNNGYTGLKPNSHGYQVSYNATDDKRNKNRPN